MEKKPILFEGACLFSLLGSSIGLLYTILATVFFQSAREIIEKFTNMTATDDLSPLYFAVLMAAFSLSLAGVIKLYRMQRSGLYFYLAAQAMILLIPVIVLGPTSFSVTNAIFTGLFAGVYLYYYRRLS